MITVDEALALVLEQVQPLAPTQVPLDAVLGLALAEDITSDIDSPPYDKSIVDGYAVRSDDLRDGTAKLTILEEVVAGTVPRATVTGGTATRIMTGAPIPDGADAVVMVERTEHAAEADVGLGSVVIREPAIRSGQNILRRATSMRAGEAVLSRGTVIHPAVVGLLAEVGRATVPVVPRPSVAILPTGNELVEVDHQPSAGQIRNSNGPLLAAAVRRAGGAPVLLPVARDEEADLHDKIAAGLAHDVLVLSGGVSAGVLDLVPRILAELGVQQVFHKVRIKPGKPLWFGTATREPRQTLVFGLPGNPVSSFVCFELFVRPAIKRMRGIAGTPWHTVRATLAAELRQRDERQTFWPAQFHINDEAVAVLKPLLWKGSADLMQVAGANALIILPPGERLFAAGEIVEAVLLGES